MIASWLGEFEKKYAEPGAIIRVTLGVIPLPQLSHTPARLTDDEAQHLEAIFIAIFRVDGLTA